METRGVYVGELEVRRGGRLLSGSFPYSSGPGNRMATVMDRGDVRKERIGPDAFGWQIQRFGELQEELGRVMQGAVDTARADIIRQELERRNVHVLAGHDFDKPMGDMLRGTARVTSTRKAVDFEVDLPAEADQPTYMKDTLAQIRANLAGGISPGFRIPPRTTVAQAEALEPEPGNPSVQVRVIQQAVLYELSIVSRPAYSGTELDVRSELEEPERRRRVWL